MTFLPPSFARISAGQTAGADSPTVLFEKLFPAGRCRGCASQGPVPRQGPWLPAAGSARPFELRTPRVRPLAAKAQPSPGAGWQSGLPSAGHHTAAPGQPRWLKCPLLCAKSLGRTSGRLAHSIKPERRAYELERERGNILSSLLKYTRYLSSCSLTFYYEKFQIPKSSNYFTVNTHIPIT